MFALQVIGQISMILALHGNLGTEINYFSIGGETINKEKYVQQQDFIMDTPETNIIFLFSNFMYIISLIAFSISKPWRK